MNFTRDEDQWQKRGEAVPDRLVVCQKAALVGARHPLQKVRNQQNPWKVPHSVEMQPLKFSLDLDLSLILKIADHAFEPLWEVSGGVHAMLDFASCDTKLISIVNRYFYALLCWAGEVEEMTKALLSFL